MALALGLTRGRKCIAAMNGYSEDVIAGAGGALWGGIASAADGRVASVYGSSDGTVVVRPLLKKMAKGSDQELKIFGGPAVGVGVATMPGYGKIAMMLGVFSAGPGQPDRSWVAPAGLIVEPARYDDFPSLSGDFFTAPDGVAAEYAADSAVLRLFRNGRSERRFWPTALDFNTGTDLAIRGSLIDGPHGAWWFTLPPAHGENDPSPAHQPITLLRITPAGDRAWHTFDVASALQPEFGAGLVPYGESLGFVSIEKLPDGGHELRLRPLHDDFSLGASRSVAGTRVGQGKMVSVAACQQPAAGDVARLFLTARGSQTTLVRRVRWEHDAPCLESVAAVPEGDGASHLGSEGHATMVLDAARAQGVDFGRKEKDAAGFRGVRCRIDEAS